MLKISSFNIRCFGSNGDYKGKIGQENRIDSLKSFMTDQFASSDVVILQEIMSLDLLPQILPDDFNFATYPHDYKRHMNVVICYKNKYEFLDILQSQYTVPNTTLDQKKSRPIVYGQLIESDSQKKLVHIFGMHLKSGFHHSKNRLKQIESLKKCIQENIQDDLPIVLGGDFNTHVTQVTKQDLDDVDLISNSLKEFDFQHVENQINTYHTPWEQEILDHFWIKSSKIKSHFNIYEIENFTSVQDFYDQISDHLPLHLKISI